MNSTHYSYERFPIDSTIQSNNISYWCTSSPDTFRYVESDSLARTLPPQSDCSPVASGCTLPIRTSKKPRKQKDPSRIRRPRNSFIVFRSHFIDARKLEADETVQQNELSKEAGFAWAAMDDEAKFPYQEIARVEQELHRIQYPDYQYSPQRSGKQRQGGTTRRDEHTPSSASLSPSSETTEPDFIFYNGYSSGHGKLEAEQTSFHDTLPQSPHYGSDTYMSVDYTEPEEAYGADEEEVFIDWASFMLPSDSELLQ